MRVAVTGGSGVVGGGVIRHLVAGGHEVRALTRTLDAAKRVSTLGAAPVDGDLLDPEAVGRLVVGCERVFHVAGVNELCTRDPEWMWRVNVDGSLIVLEACARSGVRRLVHTSSAVTLGEEEGTVGSEHSAHRGAFLSEYERSKTEAERRLLGSDRDVEVVAVNPSSVQGPGRSTGTGAIFLALARGKLPIMVDTTISLVDIDDCARGHLLAAQSGQPGERYVLSGGSLTIREAIRSLDTALGRTTSPRFVRPGLLRALAPLVETAFRMTGKQSPLCRESARVLLHGHRYDGTRATRELGLEYTPLQDTLLRTLDWFRAEGLLAPS